jgi:threonine aldolase
MSHGENIIDLRSDTVTRPTPAMRQAMFDAEVGDDVMGDDPTVTTLERTLAQRLGKEAGLFVASGTQSNLIALLTHCQRGDEYIAGATAHTYRLEGGGAAALGGIQPQPIPFEADGTLDLEKVANEVKPDNVHFANTRLLCLENTQDGKATGPGYFATARAVCDSFGLALHLDGARIFNAAVAVGCEAQAIAGPCHTVSVCLSKGLGAPVGSVLLGSAEFIHRARRWRKVVGGGMRQSGILAAAGLHALEHHVERLAEDHTNAAALAAAVNARYQGAARQYTNMVFVDLPEPELQGLIERLQQRHILLRGARWVTHLDVTAEDIGRIAEALKST